MMPVYGDSYPHQRPFAQYYYRSYDGILPQVMVDQSRPPTMYERWPHGNNYGCPIPCHGCYNHGNFPVYFGFQPTFSHFSPTPPFYCCGRHLPVSEPHPMHYARTPHHPMGQQRYEYDKDAHHCCGCPNHLSNQKNDRGVKIEEPEPDVVRKNDSLIPMQSKNYSYRTVWIPPEYALKNQGEEEGPFGSEVADQQKAPHTKKSHEDMKSSEREPRMWNGWFPLDINSLKPLIHGEDEKKKQNQQTEDGMKLLHPIFWMPPTNEQKEPEKKEQREPEKKEQRNINGWFPLDMNGLKSLMHGEDEKRKQNQQNGDGARQLSHPIIRVPPNNEQRESEKDQRNMNSWFPLDINSLKSLMQDEDRKQMENQQNEDRMRQFPYPIIWMPFKGEHGKAEEKDQGNMNAGAASAEEPPSGSKLPQVKLSESGNNLQNSETDKEHLNGQARSSQMMESTANQKIIPVKQMEVNKEENSEGAKQKTAADDPSGTSKKKQSSSPPKTSKLSPVCLRLEPLPGKKNGNSNSRSPSPPGQKGRFQGDTTKPSASSSSKEKTPEVTHSPDVCMKTSEEVAQKKIEQKAIDIVDGKACGIKNGHLISGSQMENSVNVSIGSQDGTGKSTTKRNGKDSDGCRLKEDKAVRCERHLMAKGITVEPKTNDSTEAVEGECKAEKKYLSDVQAAVLIQSVYRGFEVRKLEPLKKLKQMADVRQQVAEVRDRIRALESFTDLQKYDKERVVIGEMIMTLLLKLDTIQGLHPSLRDIRKALAKDLITLQEELDSLMTKSKGLSEGAAAAKAANDPSVDTRDDVGMQEMRTKDVGILENSSKNSYGNNVIKNEQNQGELFCSVYLASNSQGEETSEPVLGENEVHGRHENESTISPESDCLESQAGESLANMGQDETANRLIDVSQAVTTEIQEKDGMHAQPQPSTSQENIGSQELAEAQLQDSGYVSNGDNEAKIDEMSGPTNVEDNPEAESTELPLKMIDEELSGCELKNDEPASKGKSEIVDAEIKSNISVDPTLLAEVDNINEVAKEIASNVNAETNLAAELPVGLLEEDLAVENKQIETENALPILPAEVDNLNKDEKATATNIDPETNLVAELHIEVLDEDLAVDNKQIEMGKDEVLSSGEERCTIAINAASPMDLEDVMKVMVEELPGNAVFDIEENLPLSSTKGEEGSSDEVHVDEDKDGGIVAVDQMPSLESAAISVAPVESGETKEDEQQQVIDEIKEEEELEKKSQCLEREYVIETDKTDELKGSEITTSSQMSVVENGIVTDGDRKLIEENAKLGEMMEKLMDAGKEQLKVISHLTGRVQDLERKLSRNKKLRSRRYKRTTPALSGKKQTNATTAVQA